MATITMVTLPKINSTLANSGIGNKFAQKPMTPSIKLRAIVDFMSVNGRKRVPFIIFMGVIVIGSVCYWIVWANAPLLATRDLVVHAPNEAVAITGEYLIGNMEGAGGLFGNGGSAIGKHYRKFYLKISIHLKSH
ncbi:hypothetical protein [Shewanella sp. NIFS-20-20]|uniref:hypothetical protein n=1 Tax=Shewanella sp. NIFS-20-20 TaxID=2853806 RepID=UPI001C4909D9|nr:hypothetical protein [Shewanella sp. NIFS-20-20]MBV7317213.1 hypothetical protein [Shewanella sp. NIFS-20-20]